MDYKLVHHLALLESKNRQEKWVSIFFHHQHLWPFFSPLLSLCLSILSLQLPLPGTTNLMYVLHT
jgi:hypothetical protein